MADRSRANARWLAIAAVLAWLTASCATDPPRTDASEAATIEQTCEAIHDGQTATSKIDTQDIESMRSGLPDVAAALRRLEQVAPEDLLNDVEAQRALVENWRAAIEDPDLQLDSDTLYRWESPASIEADKNIGSWARQNCDEPVATDALAGRDFTFCLPSGSDRSEVSDLFERTVIPSETGRGVDLLEGIVGVAARQEGLFVSIDRLASQERVDELIAFLGAPPVIETLSGDVDCN